MAIGAAIFGVPTVDVRSSYSGGGPVRLMVRELSALDIHGLWVALEGPWWGFSSW